MIKRKIADKLVELAGTFPVVTIEGPRQSGKTTLARMTFPDHAYANLEEYAVRALAEGDPRGFLARFPAPAIIDEIQRVPQLLSELSRGDRCGAVRRPAAHPHVRPRLPVRAPVPGRERADEPTAHATSTLPCGVLGWQVHQSGDARGGDEGGILRGSTEGFYRRARGRERFPALCRVSARHRPDGVPGA